MKTTTKYSRLLRVFGKTKDEIHRGVQHYLEKSLCEIRVEFGDHIAEAAKELRARSFEEYREPSQLKAAWELATLAPLLPEWDVFTVTKPEETGIMCLDANAHTRLLSQKDFHPLQLFDGKSKWGNGVHALHFELGCWQETVCCVWSALIARNLIRRLRKQQNTLEDVADVLNSECALASSYFFEAPAIDPERPIGELLSLEDITDTEIDTFAKFREWCAMGSYSCEVSAGNIFKNWLRRASIGMCEQYQLTFKEVHPILLAGSQREPRAEIELRWDEAARTYRFAFLVKNRDAHGFDDGRAASIPESILLDFFENTSKNVKTDLVRLLVRGGWRKAEDLFRDSLRGDLD